MAKSNKETVDTLILQQGRKDAGLYQLLKYISQDLYKVYETVYDGPIVIDIGVDEINGVIDTSNLPSTIAYIDRANIFSEDQSVHKDLGSIQVGAAVPNSYMRMQAIANDDFFLGGNLHWDGGAFVSETGTGSGIRLIAGDIRFFSGNTVRFAVRSAGMFAAISAVTTGSNAGEIVLQNNRAYRASNNAGSGTHQLSHLDGNDIIRLGDSINGRSGCVGIPMMASASLPATGSAENGIIVLDTTNNRLCYYTNGNRYHLTGVSF